MFSDRVPHELAANRLAQALADVREQGRAVADLTLSNPTRAGIHYPLDLLAPLADSGSLVYDPQPLGAASARAAVADDYARQGVTIDPSRIVLCASTSDAYGTIFKLLCNPGDEVLVPRPSYPLFDHLTRLDVVTPVPYDLDEGRGWAIDVDSVERALTPRTRAVLLVSPNNPTGSFVSREEVDRLAALCAPRGIALIADEVFADYELEPGLSAAAGRVARQDRVLSFSLGGLSKSAGLPQVKLGWIAVAGPSRAVDAALQRLELICDTYLAVSTPVQVAARRLIEGGAAIRAQIASRVIANDRGLRLAMAAAPACQLLPSAGGWYAVVRVPTFESEEELVLRLLAGGVLVHPGYFFDFPRESFLVVSLLPEPMTFAAGVARIMRHFDCTTAGA